MNLNRDPIVLDLFNDIDHPSIAKIRHIFLEAQPQHRDPAVPDVVSLSDQMFDHLVRDKSTHAIVDSTPRQYHLRVVADQVGLVGKVIGVHPNTVATYQTR